MDWSIVISRQKAALLGVVARMMAMAGGVISPHAGEKAKSTSWASECEDQVSDFAREGIDWREKTIPSLAISNVWPSHSLDQAIEIAFSPARGEIGRSALPPLPRLLSLAILRLLRPAESAARRLIVIVAAGLKERVRNLSEGKPDRPLPDFSSFAKTRGPRPPAFRLFDTPWVMVPRAFGQGRRVVPKVRSLGWDGGAAPLSPLAGEMSAQQTEGGKVSAKSPPSVAFGDISPARGESGAIHRRIAALHHALNTLPQQARRLKRIMAAREKAVAEKADLRP